MQTAKPSILLLSPAFAIEEALAQQAVRFWEAHGYAPKLMPHALGKHHAFSATDAERLADLTAALEDPAAVAIHCLRGGYGLTRILDALPMQELLAAHPKYLLGFSDITAGLLALQSVGFGHLAIHAPMAAQLSDPQSPEALALINYLQHGGYSLGWQDDTAKDYPGLSLTAPVTGGNLTMLAHAIGSKYPLQASGHFLFLEDVGEQLYHLDRLLLQLKRAGALEGVVGVLLGHFTDIKDLPQGFGSTVLEIVQAYFPRVPVVAGLPAGHAQPNWPVPFGVELTLETVEGAWRLGRL